MSFKSWESTCDFIVNNGIGFYRVKGIALEEGLSAFPFHGYEIICAGICSHPFRRLHKLFSEKFPEFRVQDEIDDPDRSDDSLESSDNELDSLYADTQHSDKNTEDLEETETIIDEDATTLKEEMRNLAEDGRRLY